MSDTPRTNLFVALHQAISEVGHLEKTGWQSFDKYHYHAADQVIPAIGQAMVNNGLFCIPSIVGVETSTFETKQGAMNWRDDVHMQFTLVHAESGESWTTDYFATGNDRGDKGINKAATYAHKYFLLKLFFSGVGNDDEGSEQPAPQRKAQLQPAQRQNGNGAKPSVDMDQIEGDSAAAVFTDDPNRLDYFAGLFNDPDIKFDDHESRMITKLREDDSGRAISEKQYQFLSGLVNKLTNNAHGEVLSLIFGRPITKDDPPRGDSKALIDWLAKGTDKKPNEKHSPAVESIVARLGQKVWAEVKAAAA